MVSSSLNISEQFSVTPTNVTGNSVQDEFAYALHALNFEKVAACLQSGANPNTLIECDVRFFTKALNHLTNSEDGSEQALGMDFLLCYTASLIHNLPIYGDDTYLSTSEPFIQDLKLNIPATLLAVCYKEESLVQSFIEKGAHTEGVEGLLNLPHLNEEQRGETVEAFMEIWPLIIARMLQADQNQAVQHLIDLGIFEPEKLDLESVIELVVVECSFPKLFSYLETLESFKTLVRENPTFIENQVVRAVMWTENEAPALFDRFEKYLPEDFFIKHQQKLLFDSIGHNCTPELLSYLVSKGIDLKDFEGDYWGNNFLGAMSKYCTNLETLKFIMDQGFDPQEGLSLLFMSHPNHIGYLVDELKLDLNAQDMYEQTPVWVRLLGGTTDIYCNRHHETAFQNVNFLAGVELFKKGADIHSKLNDQDMIQMLLDFAESDDNEQYQLSIELRIKALLKMGLEVGELSDDAKERFDAFMVKDPKIDAFLEELLDGKKAIDCSLELSNRV